MKQSGITAKQTKNMENRIMFWRERNYDQSKHVSIDVIFLRCMLQTGLNTRNLSQSSLKIHVYIIHERIRDCSVFASCE